MPNRAKDWFRQAERDLAHARASAAAASHEWACFAAHQAAEKALKALHMHMGQEAWGHVLSRLFAELPPAAVGALSEPERETMSDEAKVLDGYYVPARYPNGHPDGAPFEHYGRLQSSEAIRYAGEILEFCRSRMA